MIPQEINFKRLVQDEATELVHWMLDTKQNPYEILDREVDDLEGYLQECMELDDIVSSAIALQVHRLAHNKYRNLPRFMFG